MPPGEGDRWAVSPSDHTRLMSAAEGLQTLAGLWPGEFQPIVEDDRVRFVPADEALRFWKDWWEKEKRPGHR